MDTLEKKHRSWLMSRVGQKNTKPEIIVRRMLHSLGYRFRLHRKGLPGTPDIVLPKYKTAIFVHGCFWHGHDCRAGRLPGSNQDFWKDKRERNSERDLRKIEELKALGWLVLVIWGCETKTLASLTQKLEDALPKKI